MKSGYKQTDIGVLPVDWEVKTIEEITTKVGSGITPTGGDRVYKQAGRPFVRSQNVGWGRMILDDIAYIDEKTHSTFSATEIQEGDVFLNISGASIGRSAIATKFVAGGNVNQHVCIIRSDKERLVPGFLCGFLLSVHGQSQIDSFQTGGNRQCLNFNQIRSFCTPVPPPAEQRAIAAALSEADAAITAMDEQIAKKRELKQAAMQQLLSGEKRLPGFRGGWEEKTLGECLVGNPRYGINAAAVGYSDLLPTYLRITDISENGTFNPEPKVSVDHPLSNQYMLEEGDVVFARTGASVGKSYLYNMDDGELVFAGFLIQVKPDPSVLAPQFLAFYTQTDAYWNWVQVMSMRSGQPGINGNEFSQLVISVPSVEEQQAIAEILSDMDAEITALEKLRAKQVAIKQGMMQELLTGRTRLI